METKLPLYLTEDELNQVRYALHELADRRQSQSIDSQGVLPRKACAEEATALRTLATKFSPR